MTSVSVNGGGITCDNDDCVTEIEFEENALVGTM